MKKKVIVMIELLFLSFFFSSCAKPLSNIESTVQTEKNITTQETQTKENLSNETQTNDISSKENSSEINNAENNNKEKELIAMGNVDEKNVIKVNNAIMKQTIEGFGASGGWWAQDVGGWDNINEIMDLLYDKEIGIGLNTYRYNIGAGTPNNAQDPWRIAKTVEVSPGVYDLSRDKNAINVLEKAVERGANNIVLFVTSPPARLTLSGFTSGGLTDMVSNLPEENEVEFSKYLVDITNLFLEKNIPVKYLSPLNEPNWGWSNGQEGCHYEPEQILRFAKNSGTRIARKKCPCDAIFKRFRRMERRKVYAINV